MLCNIGTIAKFRFEGLFKVNKRNFCTVFKTGNHKTMDLNETLKKTLLTNIESIFLKINYLQA